MAFDSLTEKLQNVFKNLRSKGRLTEDDVKEALKEIKRALLAADVNFKVVKDFIKSVQERAIGQDVMNGLNPGQMVIKIVNEELINLMGSETTEIKLQPGKAITVIMMAGLQGAGKTTTTAKLAGKFKLKGKKPLLVACDVYRPAAIKQLQVKGEKQWVEVFSMGENHKPANIAKAAIEHAQKNGNDLVILDTAGRLHIDEDMMAELEEIKEEVEVHQSILGKPILYVGMGEKLSDLEQFYPDRMASRILGMGDVLSLIEKAEAEIDEEKAREMTQKLKKNQFDFDDYLESIKQMKNMGGLGNIMNMLPGLGGMGGKMKGLDDEQTARKHRIAKGAGVDISEVNRMIKQFNEMKKLMKQFGKPGKKKKFGFPF